MNTYFEKFLENIELTSNQKKDAKTKYNGVCETVHTYFYESAYDGSTKFLFGSYKKKTNIRPIIKEQDVDVLVKLPYEIYEQYEAHQGNGQSELLKKIKHILSDTYTTTDNIKSWGKVVLVEFANGAHNIELLPAFEKEDGTFIIPNTSDGGSWEIFHPRDELDLFFKSNDDTNGLTRKLSKIIKKWTREVSGLCIKSYKIEEFIICFLNENSYENIDYSLIVRDFFTYLLNVVDADSKSYVQTALDRANKALNYLLENKYESATEEWKKIFGKEFPSTLSVYNEVQKSIRADKEQFIENLAQVVIDPTYKIKIDCQISIDGFRNHLLSYFLSNNIKINKRKSLEFFISEINIPEPFSIKWKVRNFGKESEEAGQLRGEITNDSGEFKTKETTSYRGDHMVECYVIKNNICVARSSIKVPVEN